MIRIDNNGSQRLVIDFSWKILCSKISFQQRYNLLLSEKYLLESLEANVSSTNYIGTDFKSFSHAEKVGHNNLNL